MLVDKKKGESFMKELMIFEGHEVEVFEYEGQVLFNPYDVAECLDLADSSVRNYLARMNNKQAILLKNSDVQDKDIRKFNNAGEKFITESGVYKLVFKSHKANAEKFTDWVTDEVLPSIRKDDGYIAGQETLTDEELLEKAVLVAQRKIAEKNKVIEQQRQKIEQGRSKVLFADAVSASDTSILVRDVAKMIRQNGVPLGEKRFYKWLRENGYICQNSTSPTQKAMELGLFEIVVRTVERGDSLLLETKTTRVTGKGQQYFINKFLNRMS